MNVRLIDFCLPPYFRPPLNKQLPLREFLYNLSKKGEEINRDVLLISKKTSFIFLSDYEYFYSIINLLDEGYALSPFSQKILDKNSKISFTDSNQYINFSFLIERNVSLKENVERNLERSKNIAYRLRDFVEDFRFSLGLKF